MIVPSLLLYAAGGAAAAFGGWMFHKIVKLRSNVRTLEKRVVELEK